MADRVHIPPIAPDEAQDGIRVVAMSDVGRVRDENQDFMGWFRVDDWQLLVVADGMGGHSGGFEASRIAVDIVRKNFVETASTQAPRDLLASAIQQANAGVREVAAHNPEMEGMGTTIVVAMVQGGQAWIAHVGDSRCYLVRGGALTQLTADHSRVNRMVEAGLLEPEAAEDHPMGHILERSIGSAAEVEVEVRELPLALCQGDRLVLCSDGFWGMVSAEEIGDIFSEPDLKTAVERGIGLALTRGADDNTTIGSLEAQQGATSGQSERPVGALETLRIRAMSRSAEVAQLAQLEPNPSARETSRPGSPVDRSGGMSEAPPAASSGSFPVMLVLGVLLLAVVLIGGLVATRFLGGDDDDDSAPAAGELPAKGSPPSGPAGTPEKASQLPVTGTAKDSAKGSREKQADTGDTPTQAPRDEAEATPGPDQSAPRPEANPPQDPPPSPAANLPEER